MFKQLFAAVLLVGSLFGQTVHTPTLEKNNTWTGTQSYAPTSNGVDILSSTRQTDTSPTGNFINFKSLAGISLFKVDILGNATATSYLAGDGTVAAPSIAFNAVTGTGWFRDSNGHLQAAHGGIPGGFFEEHVWLGSTGVYRWANTADPNQGFADTGLSRTAAGTVAVGNGTQGDITGALKAATISIPTTANTLPTTFTNDGSGGINIIPSGGAGLTFTTAGNLFLSPGKQLNLEGATSGITAIQASAIASGTLTLPAAADTLVGKATTDTLTNKTYDTAGAGNVLKIGGGTVPATKGTANQFLLMDGTGTNLIFATATLTSAQFANQGTTTTVLHGNGLGNPSFAAVSLTADVSGILSGTNGGTGVNSSATFPTSGVVVTEAAAETLTTKRITPRVQTAADATSITPTSDTADITVQTNTQIAGTLTLNAPTGTPTDGQRLIIRIKSTNAQTYAFNATYHFSTTVVAPTTLAAGKTDYIGCMWNATNTAWDVVAVDQGH